MATKTPAAPKTRLAPKRLRLEAAAAPAGTSPLTLTGTAKPYRVSGIRFEFTPEAGLSQTLALRQLRP